MFTADHLRRPFATPGSVRGAPVGAPGVAPEGFAVGAERSRGGQDPEREGLRAPDHRRPKEIASRRPGDPAPTYGSLVFTGGFGNPLATFSYKSGGRPQSSRRRVCTSVNGDNMACVCPLTSTTLTLIVFITPSSNSALGRVVWRPG